MFLINGKPLAVDTPFTDSKGNQYPSNWLRLSSQEEKEALGITEVADPVLADDRFCWNGDVSNPKALEDKLEVNEDGAPLYEQVYDPATESMVDSTKRLVTKGLKSTFIAQVNQTAYSLLLPTDWMIIRKFERAVEIPQEVVTTRLGIIAECSRLISAIQACSDVAELITVMNSQSWPQ